MQDALSLLHQHLPDAEYRSYALAIADAIHAVNAALLEKPLRDKPALKAEIESSIERYGRSL